MPRNLKGVLKSNGLAEIIPDEPGRVMLPRDGSIKKIYKIFLMRNRDGH
ncbi:hypothetical protein [Aquimarina sp. AD10]|nr:hypothetical protein [Aquimarina sp. AD10]